MKIIKPSAEILAPVNGVEVLKFIELIGRKCYKSEDKITDESAYKFVEMLIKRGHEAMIEHYNVSVLFTCDRGVSHEIVRHRIASYAQESTRYCNYSKDKHGNELTFIEPFFWAGPHFTFSTTERCYEEWKKSCEAAEKTYIEMLTLGKASPQEARSILPNSIKTELVMTTNLREWRHFFKLRTAEGAHPQMREITIPLLQEFKRLIPIVFDDIHKCLEEEAGTTITKDNRK